MARSPGSGIQLAEFESQVSLLLADRNFHSAHESEIQTALLSVLCDLGQVTTFLSSFLCKMWVGSGELDL